MTRERSRYSRKRFRKRLSSGPRGMTLGSCSRKVDFQPGISALSRQVSSRSRVRRSIGSAHRGTCMRLYQSKYLSA